MYVCNKKTGEEALARVNVSVCSATDGLINAGTCFKLAPIFDLSSFLLTLKRGISYPAVAAYWRHLFQAQALPNPALFYTTMYNLPVRLLTFNIIGLNRKNAKM